ncbi:MAG: hypothetical protein ACLRQ0_14095 [Monoglobales bacterium]
MLTRKQLTFLKYLKAHEPLSYDEILDKYSESELSRTFDILLQNGYITTDSPPVISLYSNRSKPRRTMYRIRVLLLLSCQKINSTAS